jgi:transposase
MDKEKLVLSNKERDRLRVIALVDQNVISPKDGAEMVGITARQFRRVRKRHSEEGDRGLAHRSRGRPSNRRIPDEIRQDAVDEIREKYPDFGPRLASEKLAEDGIIASEETVRKWMIKEGIWKPRKRRERHRQRRERRRRFGEMIQLDGSDHDWFEGRGPRPTLMAMIDDATNTILARFGPVEDTRNTMLLLKSWLTTYGRPGAIYADRHGMWVAKAGEAGEKEDVATTQLRRALGELNIDFIAAHSPQAKGRVERLFGIFQDRLVKEMRLEGIDNIDDANRFLEKFIPRYNERFGKKPASRADAHRRLGPGFNLDHILSEHHQRRVANDYTVRFRNRFFQIGKPARPGLRGGRATVALHLDGSIHLTFKGKSLKWHEIETAGRKTKGNGNACDSTAAALPTGEPTSPPGPQTNQHRKPWVPPPDHPWRRFKIRAT